MLVCICLHLLYTSSQDLSRLITLVHALDTAVLVRVCWYDGGGNVHEKEL